MYSHPGKIANLEHPKFGVVYKRADGGINLQTLFVRPFFVYTLEALFLKNLHA
jgi:hypothetical protein